MNVVRILAGSVAVLLLLLGAGNAGVARASSGEGMCVADPGRGSVPSSFPLAACVSSDGVWLRNDLHVPVVLGVEGDTGTPVVISTDAGLAADVTRTLDHNALLLVPGDLVRIPFGSGAAKVGIVSAADGGVYAMATAFFTFAGGQVVNVTNVVTALIAELAADLGKYRDCLTGANFVIQQACKIVFTSDVVFAFGRAGVLGLAKGVIALFLNAAQLMQFVDQQVPDVRAILYGTRSVTISPLSKVAPAVEPVPIPQHDPPQQPPMPDAPPQPVTNPPAGPRPVGALTVSFTEEPYVCDGGSRHMGTVSGAVPGEMISFSSPTVSGLLSAPADRYGNRTIRWQCQPSETNASWDVTATGQSGRTVTFTIHGQAPAAAQPTNAAGSLQIRVDVNPFRCDGGSRYLGLLTGAQPGETLTFFSPTVSGMLSGFADPSGALKLIWQCQPPEAGQTWTVTATGSTSQRQGTFTVTGG